MPRVQTRGRFHITKAGYALVKELIQHPEFLFEDFTPKQVNRVLGRNIAGATYFGLRVGYVLESGNGRKKRRTAGPKGNREVYRFTSEFRKYTQTEKGMEYFGVKQE